MIFNNCNTSHVLTGPLGHAYQIASFPRALPSASWSKCQVGWPVLHAWTLSPGLCMCSERQRPLSQWVWAQARSCRAWSTRGWLSLESLTQLCLQTWFCTVQGPPPGGHNRSAVCLFFSPQVLGINCTRILPGSVPHRPHASCAPR
jgi:hypothetical protein